MAVRTVLQEVATERARYAGVTPERQAAYAREMLGEVLDHYDHARTLVAALVTELTDLKETNKAARHLATVAENWLNDPDHVAQEVRLTACLAAMAEGGARG